MKNETCQDCHIPKSTGFADINFSDIVGTDSIFLVAEK
jgi:hypothetical protein